MHQLLSYGTRQETMGGSLKAAHNIIKPRLRWSSELLSCPPERSEEVLTVRTQLHNLTPSQKTETRTALGARRGQNPDVNSSHSPSPAAQGSAQMLRSWFHPKHIWQGQRLETTCCQ